MSRVTQYTVGYPNEEAYWRDPRGEIGHGICEIIGSGWRESVDSYNRATFGTDYASAWTGGKRFFIGSKDASAQFLADQIDLEVFMGATMRAAYTDARREALRRLGSYPEP